MPSISWKLKSGTLLCYLFLFSPSHLTRNHDANRAPRAYIYVLEAGFSQVAKNCQVFCQTVRGVFLMFFPKNQRCQLDLPNCWRCSNNLACRRLYTCSTSLIVHLTANWYNGSLLIGSTSSPHKVSWNICFSWLQSLLPASPLSPLLSSPPQH